MLTTTTVKSARPLKKNKRKGREYGIYFSNIFKAGII